MAKPDIGSFQTVPRFVSSCETVVLSIPYVELQHLFIYLLPKEKDFSLQGGFSSNGCLCPQLTNACLPPPPRTETLLDVDDDVKGCAAGFRERNLESSLSFTVIVGKPPFQYCTPPTPTPTPPPEASEFCETIDQETVAAAGAGRPGNGPLE